MSAAAFRLISIRSSEDGGGGAGGPRVLLGKIMERTCKSSGGRRVGVNMRVEIV